ncbi:MAG: exodeoxyribonuclease V subunit gamma [bacterium]|nr:exodeoxyribonuclease V subunit gamma [bacterium]
MIDVIQEHDGGALFARLAGDMARRPPAPLEEEIILVESVGMARRLPLELARRLGSVARLATPFPARFIWERLLRPGLAAPATESPWEVEALAWRIADLLRQEPALAGPAGRLLDQDDGRRRHALARRLASLFDQYLVHRPGLLLGWEGRPHGNLPGGPDPPPDSPMAHWQRNLWRRLGGEIAEPHRAALLADWLEQARAGAPPPGVAELPGRLSLFALHGLPPAQLAVFDALSRHRELRVYLLNPSPEYWGDLPRRHRRREALDPWTAPLLQANGAELGGWIDQLLEVEARFHDPAPTTAPREGSLLERIRHSQAELAPLPAGPPDDSLQFHSCHSLTRQAEVMVDRLLDLFERHPDLRPGDVLVLVPDLEAARPALEAVLEGQEEERRLPWRLLGGQARRSMAQALAQVMALAGGRWELAAVLAPLSCPALRRRHRIPAEELPRLQEWCTEAGVVWGWDAADRAARDLPAVAEHGWRSGLDRLLLGYAMEGTEAVAGLLPAAGGAAQPALLEAWLEWLALLRDFQEQSGRPRSPGEWHAWLADGLPLLFAPDGEDEENELAALRERLLRAGRLADASDGREACAWPVAREALALALEARGLIRGGAFDGRVTVAPMLAARGLPAEVVVLLGLDDQAFPRPSRRDELDLCLLRPHPGDRQPRLQDRGLFLDALWSARRALLIFWNGRDERENTVRPPSVVVSELLDLLGREGGRVRQHPLQGFNPACYQGPPSERSFHQGRGRAAARLARVLADPAAAALPGPAFLAPLPLPAPPDEVQLGDLTSFFRNPAKAFLRRAGLRLPWEAAPPRDHEPFTLDPAARGGLRHRLLRERLAGLDPAGEEERLRAGGLLPWGRPGRALLEALQREVAELLARADEALCGVAPSACELDLSLGGLRLRGGLAAAGLRRVELSSSSLDSGPRLTEWIPHLAWCCLGSEDGTAEGRETMLVHRGGALLLRCPDQPGGQLEAVLRHWREGQDRWLPWLPEVSEAIARHARRLEHATPDCLLDRDWYHGRDWLREDPWLALALGEADPFTHPALAGPVLELALALGAPIGEGGP